MTVKQLIGAMLIAQGVPPEQASAAVAAACEAVRLNPKAIIPTVEVGKDAPKCKLEDCEPDRYIELYGQGLRFSDKPAKSRYDERGGYCHYIVGGAGTKHGPGFVRYYQTEGPTFKLEKGEHAGRSYKATLCADCYAHLENARLDAQAAIG